MRIMTSLPSHTTLTMEKTDQDLVPTLVDKINEINRRTQLSFEFQMSFIISIPIVIDHVCMIYV